MNLEFRGFPDQRGAVLLVSLIMLVVLMLLGVTAFRMATLQERMTGNARDRGVAFQAAEAALAAADASFFGPSATSAFSTNGSFDGSTCVKGILPYVAGSGPYLLANDKGDGSSAEFWEKTWPWDDDKCYYTDGLSLRKKGDTGAVGGSTASTPRYVIEEISLSPPTYRVTALGYGMTSGARVVLQATYTAVY